MIWNLVLSTWNFPLQWFDQPEPHLYISEVPMAIHAIKKGQESNDRLMTRFKKQVQEARFMKTLRERMRFKGKPTRRLARIRALVREENRKNNTKAKFYSNM